MKNCQNLTWAKDSKHCEHVCLIVLFTVKEAWKKKNFIAIASVGHDVTNETGLLSFILSSSGPDCSYLFEGVVLGHDTADHIWQGDRDLNQSIGEGRQ